MLSYNEHRMLKADPEIVWTDLREEAQAAAAADPAMASFFQNAILSHDNLASVIIGRVCARLWTRELNENQLRQIFTEQVTKIPHYLSSVVADIMAVYHRDPACHRLIEPIMYLKGFLAIQSHRFAHSLWQSGRKDLAYFLQARSSSVFQTDIHPAANIGQGVFLDHATGFVMGETARVEDYVSILHGVTLGGTGKDCGDRHPKIHKGVLIGAGAKILGNINIGECAKIAAGSVVLHDVPAHATVAGVPARVIGAPCKGKPALDMDQSLES